MAQQSTSSLDNYFKKTHTKAASNATAYSEPYQTSNMELLTKTRNGWKLHVRCLTLF